MRDVVLFFVSMPAAIRGAMLIYDDFGGMTLTYALTALLAAVAVTIWFIAGRPAIPRR